MPHLIIETTADIAALPDFDASALLEAGLGALRDLGEYDMASAKARTRVLTDYRVDLPHDGTGFIAVSLRILPGRDERLRARTSQAIARAVAEAAPAGATGTVSVEVVEMEGHSYTKVALG